MSRPKQEIIYLDLSNDTQAKDAAAEASEAIGLGFKSFTEPIVAYHHASPGHLAGVIESRPKIDQAGKSRLLRIQGSLARLLSPESDAQSESQRVLQKRSDLRYMREIATKLDVPYVLFQPVPEDVSLMPLDRGSGNTFNFHAGSENLHLDMQTWLGERLVQPEESHLTAVPDQA